MRCSTRLWGTTQRRGKDHGRGPEADEYMEVVGSVDTARDEGKEEG
jgi:hypothetical protein